MQTFSLREAKEGLVHANSHCGSSSLADASNESVGSNSGTSETRTGGTSTNDSNGSRSGSSDGTRLTDEQMDHRVKQIDLVKSRPEYLDIHSKLPPFARTGTPDPRDPISNRAFECEIQLWHRSLHICCDHMRGLVGSLRNRTNKEPTPGSRTKTTKTKRKKVEERREARAHACAGSLLHAAFAPPEPFDDSHTFIECFSTRINEAWAASRNARTSITLADPSQANIMVDCCHRFPVLVGYPLHSMLGKECNFLLQHAEQGHRKSMQEVIRGNRSNITCIVSMFRAGEYRFSNLIQLINVWRSDKEGQKRFVLGIHCDISELYLGCDDLYEMENTAVEALQESSEVSVAMEVLPRD